VAALLKVHPSNYQISGFTQSVSVAELSSLAHRKNVPLIHDIGSGALVDLTCFGSDREPVAVNSINAGADIVLFSGDKLLGGPQSGIIIGRKELVARIDRNPLMRALRVDKLTLAALQATLQLYRRPQSLNHALPLAVLIATPIAELRQRAERIVEGLRDLAPNVRVSIVEASAYIGGGSCPGQEIESVAVRIESTQLSEKRLASRLRTVRPAVVPRVRDEAVLIDLRGVFPDQDAMLQGSIRAALLGSEIAQDGSSS
jgi:L-seryl-tRNA(Ser) seleniumtransferase